MAIATPKMTLKDYLNYEDSTENLYELEAGELRIMPPQSELNRRTTMFLLLHFAKLGVSFSRLSTKTEIVVLGARATVRLPDLLVLSEELVLALAGASRSTVLLDMPPPELVIEVVSPGKQNLDRDYRYKRSQYEARGIQEYWIIDPIQAEITLFTLFEGLYEEAVFTGDRAIASGLLQKLGQTTPLTAAQVLNSGANP